MITKLISILSLTLLSLVNLPNAVAGELFTANMPDQTHTLYCAESDSNNDENGYASEEEPGCD